MKIKGDNNEKEDDKELRITLMKLSFEKTFDANNVDYNEDSGFFEIYSEKDVIAVSDNGQTNWKFLVVEKEQMYILERLVPESILKRI